ncbi:MAG TPA: fibronectin type III domain-containing protein [Patescibacteria group bacterium]|nr:fibronectin type III domain-containing protein [Patescibacteria group bacterium]
MIRAMICVVAIALVCFVSCGKDHEGLPTGFDYDPPPTPSDFQATAGVEQAHLSWSYPAESLPTLLEFRVYYYYSIYDMVELVGTTTETEFTDTQLIGNVEYCYRVSAVDTSDFEGWRTAVQCVTVLSGFR